MFYDLSIPWTADHASLSRTLSFLAELGYDVVALNQVLRGKLPAEISCAIPDPLPFATPPRLRILRRCTLELADATQNHRLGALAAAYDVLALRPTEERALTLACTALDCDLLSLDMSARYPFHFKFKMLGAAVARGVRLEICYGQAIGGGGGDPDPVARRNLISNATSMVRAARGRGIVVSSEAPTPLACRAPWDAVNLATIWGLSPERAREAVGKEARAVVVQAAMKRSSFRGVVDVVYGGEKPEPPKPKAAAGGGGQKRKAGTMEGKSQGQGQPQVGGEVVLSKREKKRRAHAARMEAEKVAKEAADIGQASATKT